MLDHICDNWVVNVKNGEISIVYKPVKCPFNEKVR
jgi:hypothetical protein